MNLTPDVDGKYSLTRDELYNLIDCIMKEKAAMDSQTSFTPAYQINEVFYRITKIRPTV
jgi:hypothetical protein